MPGPAAAPIANMLARVFERVREKEWPAARKWAMQEADLLGGAATDMPEKKVLHTQGSYNLTKALGNVMDPQLAANLADSAYLGNEFLTGVLSKMTGRDFFSPYGFNWSDVSLNRTGQDQAIEDLLSRIRPLPPRGGGPVTR